MEKLIKSQLKLGIIAGGQLAKMLIQEASKWNIISYVMDKDEYCPAKTIASYFIKGDPLDFDSVYQFGKKVDILTFEIENINTDALKKLKSEGYKINPDPEILELIKDKGLQRDFCIQNNIPVPQFVKYDSVDLIINSIKNGEIKYPFVQKLRKGGYDGRGVSIINDENDLPKLLPGQSIIEEKIEIFKEISVIVARNNKGEIRAYPVVEMVFNKKANLLDKLISPALITKEETEKAISIASKIIQLLKMEGLLAIEFFIDNKGNIFVNEMAPRPHNSGHHTIESNITSQFEQHLRAIINLPLGSTDLKFPSVMMNLLGEEGYEGPAIYEGLEEVMAIDGVKVHLYGKKITKPFRKMGHITIISSSLESALEKAEKVKKLIRVKA